jgi:hypothetical protein
VERGDSGCSVVDGDRSQAQSLDAILRGGSRIYRERFVQLLLVATLTYAPIALIALTIDIESLPLNSGVRDGRVIVGSAEALDRMTTLIGITWFAALLGSVISIASLHHTVADAYLEGTRGWRRSVTESLRRWPAILGMVLAVFGLALGPLILTAGAPGPLGAAPLPAALVIVGWLLWMVALGLVAAIAMPAMMHERIGPLAALGRAATLMRRNWLRTFGLFFVLSIAVGLTWRVLFGALRAVLTANAGTASGLLGGTMLAQIVTSIVVVPFAVAIVTVTYFDLVARADGPAMAGIGETGRPLVQPDPATPEPLSPLLRPTVTRAEIAAPVAAPAAMPGPRWAEPLGPM